MTIENRRQFLTRALGTAVALSGAGALLAACGDGDDTAAQRRSTTTKAGEATTTTAKPVTKVRAMMPFPLTLNFIADMNAKTSGHFADEGLDVDLQFAQSAPQTLQQLVAGNVDLVRNAPLAIIKGVAEQNAPLVSVATVNQSLLYRFVTTAAKPLASIKALSGKTLGLPTLGGNAEDTLNAVLRDAGVDPASVKRVASGNDAASFAFVQDGRVDALFATAEVASTLKAKGQQIAVLDTKDTNPLLGTLYAATRSYADANGETITAYFRALKKSMAELSDAQKVDALLPELAKEWEHPAFSDPTTAKAIIAAQVELWDAAGEDNRLVNVPERWDRGLASFKKLGMVKTDKTADAFYTNDYVE